jgi:hypothetical protein
VRHAHAADRAARARNADRRCHRRPAADALEHAVNAFAGSDVAHALHGFFAAFAHDIRCAKRPCQRNSIRVAS